MRLLAVSGTVAALPAAEKGLGGAADAEGFQRMNEHLWQVYRLSTTEHAVYPVVRSQLAALNDALRDGEQPESICVAAGDLFQLAGELAFDANRYEAAASYALAASVKQGGGCLRPVGVRPDPQCVRGTERAPLSACSRCSGGSATRRFTGGSWSGDQVLGRCRAG